MPLTLLRRAMLLAALALLAACANGANLGEMRTELGDFRLGHNIVLTENTVKGPLSREADPATLSTALHDEIARRFDRYEGDRLYHLAINIDAYILAVPGIPLVASPRSALIVGVFVWDDVLGRPLNEERRQFTVLESMSGESVIGSGLTQSADEQLLNLSRNAALHIENWLAENPEWFDHQTAAAEEIPAQEPIPTTPPAALVSPPATTTPRRPAPATPPVAAAAAVVPAPPVVPVRPTAPPRRPTPPAANG